MSFSGSLRTIVTGRRRPVRLPAPATPGAVSVAVRGVDLSLGGAPVLRGVDLTVRAGEIRALIGPNGAGKSSLLGVVTGDRRPDAGQVELDGRPADDWRPDELAMRRAVLTQEIMLSFPFTVREVVQMGRSPWRGTPFEEDDDAVVAAALESTEVTHLAERQFTTLSGGERARVALSRVLAQRTHVLMLDEPTAALDLRHQELVLQHARAHARAGGAVVVVVHDVSLASAYADAVTVLDAGCVVGDGPPAQVLTSELLSAVYDYPVDVLPGPGGTPLIVPRR